MIVGGYNQPAIIARPTMAAAAPASAADRSSTAAEEARETNPTYFRSISSVGYGSLAGAYQSFRALESAAGGRPATADTGQAPAILSGMGIPAALSAYGEAIESGKG